MEIVITVLFFVSVFVAAWMTMQIPLVVAASIVTRRNSSLTPNLFIMSLAYATAFTSYQFF